MENIVDKFLRYVSVETTSNEAGEGQPSSECQWNLLNMLKDEEADKRLILRREVVNDGYFCVEVEPFDFSKNRTSSPAIVDEDVPLAPQLSRHIY